MRAAYLQQIIAKSSAHWKDVVLARTYMMFFCVSVGIITELSPRVKATSTSVGPSRRISTVNCRTECLSPFLITCIRDSGTDFRSRSGAGSVLD